MPKICGLSAPFPGAKRPLEEGAKLGLLEFILLSGDSKIMIPDADIYILAAWHPGYQEFIGLAAGCKLGVLWTSSGGEMDLEPVEQGYLWELNRDPRISFIWFGDPALAQVYPEKGFHLPYPLAVDGVTTPDVDKKDIVTLFCPTGPKKNIFNQLLAMKLVQRKRKIVLHTNIYGYNEILKEVDHVRHGWLLDKEYQELLASAKVNLACSWCETFNYNVGEAGLMGTVSVISKAIPLPGYTVGDPSNPTHIAEKILEAIDSNSNEGILTSMREQLKLRNQVVMNFPWSEKL